MINSVVNELNSYGLSHDIVDDLLNPHNRTTVQIGGATPGGQRSTPGSILQLNSTTSSPESPNSARKSPASTWISSLPISESSKTRSPRRVSTAGLAVQPSDVSPNTFVLLPKEKSGSRSASVSRSQSVSGMHYSPAKTLNSAMNLPPLALPAGSLQAHDLPLPPNAAKHPNQTNSPHDWNASHWMEKKVPALLPEDLSEDNNIQGRSGVANMNKHHWVESKSGRRAWGEYQLYSDALEFHPNIVLHMELPDSEEPFDVSFKSMRNSTSPHTTPLTTPRFANARNSYSHTLAKQVQDLNLGPAAQEVPSTLLNGAEIPSQEETDKPGYHRYRVVLPLAADERFFNALIESIRTLLKLHMIQQATLINQVKSLCDVISQVASPVNAPKDMYEWREIFSLWLEHDIFESSREKDRGELSVAATENRFHKYMEQLEKRGFISPHETRTVHGNWVTSQIDSWNLESYTPNSRLSDSRSVGALDYFLRLNMALVLLKRYQRFNIETIRKILKKHMKKTALHANSSISRMAMSSHAHQLVLAASEDAPIPEIDWNHASSADILKSLTALAPMNSQSTMQLSLPRILASMMTKDLLPILPRVEDYSCMVCTSIAWHPIRLRCDHLFCIRCLVKLQKQGDNHCPLCRSTDAVKDADESNYDKEMADFLRLWFPREIEEKSQENKSDRVVQSKKEKAIRRKNRWAKLTGRRTSDEDHDCIIS